MVSFANGTVVIVIPGASTPLICRIHCFIQVLALPVSGFTIADWSDGAVEIGFLVGLATQGLPRCRVY
jgi:hypothetical protein